MSSDNENVSKIIKGIPKLAEFYGLSVPTIRKYMSLPYPLPGVKIDGQWLFHIENVDAWFKKITLQNPKHSGIDEGYFEDLSENPS